MDKTDLKDFRARVFSDILGCSDFDTSKNICKTLAPFYCFFKVMMQIQSQEELVLGVMGISTSSPNHGVENIWKFVGK